MVFNLHLAASEELRDEINIDKITLENTDEKFQLKDLIPKIEEQTGYKISLDQYFENFPVQGVYVEVNLNTFFHRVLRRENYTLVIEENIKSIHVKKFTSRGEIYSNEDNSTVEQIDPVDNIYNSYSVEATKPYIKEAVVKAPSGSIFDDPLSVLPSTSKTAVGGNEKH